MNNWVKVFKNGPSKICAKQPLENLKWYGLPKQSTFLKAGCFLQISLGPFLNTLTQLLFTRFIHGLAKHWNTKHQLIFEGKIFIINCLMRIFLKRCWSVTSIGRDDFNTFSSVVITSVILHCLKFVQMRSFFWSVFSRIQSKYGKIRNQKKLRIWTLFVQCC